MALSRRAALILSLGVIVAHAAWQVVSLRDGPAPLPAEFSELVWRIVRTKVLVLGTIAALLWLSGEGFSALGVRRDGWARHVGIGLAAGALMFVVFNAALQSMLGAIVPQPPASGPSMMSFFRDPKHLLAWLPIGIFGGGVVEELQRIFVITRFEAWLGRKGLWLGIAVSSATFGLAHLYQGVAAAIVSAISALVFAALYLRWRSALVPIAAHAGSDVLAMVAATFLAR
jgi:membrane protease YdiL (CAAX protease family)